MESREQKAESRMNKKEIIKKLIRDNLWKSVD
jgi:hypothetical protein